MKTALIIVGLVALASAAPKVNKLGFRNLYRQPLVKLESKPGSRIVNGQEASPHSLPYQAFLEVYSSSEGWYCGGSLISADYVITAGHCGDGARQAYVTLGAQNVQQNENTQQQFQSTDITVHPRYSEEDLNNDVSVVRLPQSARLNDAVQIIALPSSANNDYVGTSARASGWGLTDGKGSTISSVLRYIDVEVISNSACGRIYGSLDSSVLCTSGNRDTTVCSGDSGGPLVANGVLIGVTSFAAQDCTVGYPSGFARVTTFLDWLESNTNARI